MLIFESHSVETTHQLHPGHHVAMKVTTITTTGQQQMAQKTITAYMTRNMKTAQEMLTSLGL
jgi:hypothetical protein